MMSRRLLPLIIILAVLAIALHACKTVLPESPVYFVDRDGVNEEEDPLALVVGIHSGGRLTLNQIETGFVGDQSVLNERLRTILEDRRRRSISENEVLIEIVGTIAYEDIDALITSLQALRPSRITVITK